VSAEQVSAEPQTEQVISFHAECIATGHTWAEEYLPTYLRDALDRVLREYDFYVTNVYFRRLPSKGRPPASGPRAETGRRDEG